jgi:hypothetical protein
VHCNLSVLKRKKDFLKRNTGMAFKKPDNGAVRFGDVVFKLLEMILKL